MFKPPKSGVYSARIGILSAEIGIFKLKGKVLNEEKNDVNKHL